jgi:hypothetical protein
VSFIKRAEFLRQLRDYQSLCGISLVDDAGDDDDDGYKEGKAMNILQFLSVAILSNTQLERDQPRGLVVRGSAY